MIGMGSPHISNGEIASNEDLFSCLLVGASRHVHVQNALAVITM